MIASKPKSIEFYKYVVLENDFIIFDQREKGELGMTPEQLKLMCDRHNGVGADGLCIISKADSKDVDYKYSFLNNAGEISLICGNLFLSFVSLLGKLARPQTEFTYETKIGVMNGKILPDGRIRSSAGSFFYKAKDIPSTLVPAEETMIEKEISIGGETWKITVLSMGQIDVRVCVFVEDVEQFDADKWGACFMEELISYFPSMHICFPVSFIQVISRHKIQIKTWENHVIKVSGACGSGSCAAMVAAHILGYVDDVVDVLNPAGILEVEYDSPNNLVYLTGPANFVFKGIYFIK